MPWFSRQLPSSRRNWCSFWDASAKHAKHAEKCGNVEWMFHRACKKQDMHISTLWSTWRKTSRFMLENVTTLSPLWISVRHVQIVRWGRHWLLWSKTSHIECGTPRWTSGFDYWNHKDISHSGCNEHTPSKPMWIAEKCRQGCSYHCPGDNG